MNNSGIILRPAIVADLPGMVGLERQSPSAAHWADAQYRSLFAPSASERLILIAENRDGGISGFLVAHRIATDWELENIVVSSKQLRAGLGSRLLSALLARANHTSSYSIFLEVRESNSAARAFYEKAGFQSAGRRKNYYADPPEDAILYTLTVG